MYSGTIGIAREAAFWGIPAIAFSSDGGPDLTNAGKDWVAHLIGRLWDRQSSWAKPGCWLSINLPAELPAPLRPIERVGSNKIGTRCEVVSRIGDTTTLLIPRGRERTSEPGDENALLAQGYAVYSLQSWRDMAVVSPELSRALSSAR